MHPGEIGRRAALEITPHGAFYPPTMAAVTGNEAVREVQAGIKAVAVSGWQVAANADKMFPDAGLYPWNSVPRVVRSINNAPQRADQIFSCEGRNQI
jgi:isocitrate lyase